MDKSGAQHVEMASVEGDNSSSVNAYIQARHGTLDLVPFPTADPDDPYNWPSWKKNLLLWIVSFHALMSTFSASAAIPTFMVLAAEFDVSLNRMSYSVAIQIACIGFLPLFWTPLANRFGRRPIYMISSLLSAAMCLAQAFTTNYFTFMLVRAIQASCISSAVGIGGATVAEMFFRHERGTKMGVWTLLVTLGPTTAPFIFGFVVQHLSWHWVFYILAMLQFGLFIMYCFFGYETLYMRNEYATPEGTTLAKPGMFSFRRINPEPLTIVDFVRPYRWLLNSDILLAGTSYAIVFTYTSVLLTVETPQLFGEKFHFGPQQTGYQFLAIILGSVLGEQFGGRFSDFVINSRVKRAGYRVPEMRLIASWPGYVLCCVGVLMYGVLLEQTPELHWNVKPLIGSAMAAFGSQIITTVCVTYCIERHIKHASELSIIITLWRQTWAFVGPFYFGPAFTSLGVGGACILFGALCGICIVPIWILELRPSVRRQRKEAQARAQQDAGSKA